MVSLFYGTIMVIYVSPTSESSVAMHKIITLIHSVVTPVLNPFIYSLRKKKILCMVVIIMDICHYICFQNHRMYNKRLVP